MRKLFAIFFLVNFAFFIFSCKGKKVERSKHLTFYPNKFYNGPNDTSKMVATLFVQEKKDFLQCLNGLSSKEDTTAYILKICKKDTTNPLGYNPTPYVDFDTINNDLPKGADISGIEFDELFNSDIQYYYILKSYTEPSDDTSRLMIFSLLYN